MASGSKIMKVTHGLSDHGRGQKMSDAHRISVPAHKSLNKNPKGKLPIKVGGSMPKTNLGD